MVTQRCFTNIIHFNQSFTYFSQARFRNPSRRLNLYYRCRIRRTARSVFPLLVDSLRSEINIKVWLTKQSHGFQRLLLFALQVKLPWPKPSQLCVTSACGSSAIAFPNYNPPEFLTRIVRRVSNSAVTGQKFDKSPERYCLWRLLPWAKSWLKSSVL